jgi:hypothetical protein
MAKRSTTKGKVVPFRQERDFNQMARAVVEHVEKIADEEPGKNPAAVALGRRGGLKGGKARMASLTPEQRRRLGLKGARSRWGKSTTKR